MFRDVEKKKGQSLRKKKKTRKRAGRKKKRKIQCRISMEDRKNVSGAIVMYRAEKKLEDETKTYPQLAHSFRGRGFTSLASTLSKAQTLSNILKAACRAARRRYSKPKPSSAAFPFLPFATLGPSLARRNATCSFAFVCYTSWAEAHSLLKFRFR